MSGVKGRSGRKSWDKELETKKLWDLSIPILKFALTSEKVSFNKKVDIALALVNKIIPTELKGSGFVQESKIILISPKQKESLPNANRIDAIAV